MNAKEKLLEYFKANIGTYIPNSDLRKVSGINEFARQIRFLRQEGWDIVWKWGNKRTWYCLRTLTKSASGKTRNQIDRKTRYRILQRDNSTCQRCGKTPADGVKLSIDHKIPVDWGGNGEDTNLWTLCRECNEGKKAFFSDFNAETMKAIAQLPSTRERLMEFIRRSYGKPLPVHMLQVIARTREWTRMVRRLRQEGEFEYIFNAKEGTYTFSSKNLSPVEKK